MGSLAHHHLPPSHQSVAPPPPPFSQQYRQTPQSVQQHDPRIPRQSPTILASPTTSSPYSQQLFYARRPPLAEACSDPTAMPRPNPPPTPGSSSDIRGKDGATNAPPAFHLPPTAYQDAAVDRASTSSATPSANGSDSSYRPASPTSPADLSRKRSAAAAAQSGGPVITKDDFTLPPPPTRSRKIIQMKPRDSSNGGDQQQQQQDLPTAPPAPSPQILAKTQSAPQTGGGAGGKKKQNNAGSTAAGRKIARKTAHSLIERRRRSKMNEEFGVLKDMIPACRGQEMHKLAILQASIEYLRYLEQCVSDLQSQGNGSASRPQQSSSTPALRTMQDDNDNDDELDEEEDEDEEMADDPGETAASTPVTANSSTAQLNDRYNNSNISLPSLAQITTNTSTNSPSVFSTNNSAAGGRHYSISSASQASYSPYFHSTQTSPAFGPQLSTHGPGGLTAGSSVAPFGLGSPALKPADAGAGQGVYQSLFHSQNQSQTQQQQQSLRQIAEGANAELSESQLRSQQAHRSPPRNGSSGGSSNGNGNGNGNDHGNGSGRKRSEHELDHEASAALLMLNHDRRSWVGGSDGATGAGSNAKRRILAAGTGGSSSSSGGMSVKDLLSG